MTRVDPVAIKGCARVDERSVLYTTMYDVRFPEVYLIFRLISIKAAGGAGWRSWLADRRYRGTRCLFANAHRALMNLWTRQEARRIEIRPDTSYFFLSPLSFFLPPPSFPLSFHYFRRDCEETIQPTFPRTWKLVARFLKNDSKLLFPSFFSIFDIFNIVFEN